MVVDAPTFLGIAWNDAVTLAITVVGVPLAILALFQTRKAMRAQAIGGDLQTVMALLEKLDDHWRRFREAPSGSNDETFEFGQLTTYYEFACDLFKDNILSTKATRTLEEHLRDVLPAILKDPGFSARFNALKSDPTTFENIRWFIEHHRAPPANALSP
jgi:hypothetical protein